jgi:hypothetical protein
VEVEKQKTEEFAQFITHSLMELSPSEKPPTVQLLKNFPAFYGTRKFITVFTRAFH